MIGGIAKVDRTVPRANDSEWIVDLRLGRGTAIASEALHSRPGQHVNFSTGAKGRGEDESSGEQ